MAKKPSGKTPRKAPRSTTPAKKSARPDKSAATNGDIEEAISATSSSEQPQPHEESQLAVVGIGASAGGFEAFRKLLTALPSDTGMAYVLIQHLDPTHASLTSELLVRHTSMRVSQIKDGVAVEANHVYVIPPNAYVTIRAGVLELKEPTERRGLRLPIDAFFRSLAEDRQQRAVGIILSGTGTDGTLGVREIKANGGMVMVQTPETAQYDGMPRSAIGTNSVDVVTPVEQMPEVLVRYRQHPYVQGVVGQSTPTEPVTDHLQAVLGMLRARLKYDFSCYKKGTLSRRVQRRMSIHHIDTMQQYVELLRRSTEEIGQLFNDMLIGVTNFFREPEAWEELKTQVIAPLVSEHQDGLPIRAWVPGCSTGEEPYSLAMILIEQCQAAGKGCDVQIFASDIDRIALETARQGTYPESIAADVTPERLRQFFIKAEHAFRINKEVRDTVVFAEQNMISDPPFSKLDLISCRNLLIYLEPETQKKILAMFHFALRPGGYLLLGNSETIHQHDDLFQAISRKWRIYHRIGRGRAPRLELPTRPQYGARLAPPSPVPSGDTHTRHLKTLVPQLLLQRFAPASVVINRQAEVLFVTGPVDRYLQVPAGELQSDVIGMAREGLRARLRAALHQALHDHQPVSIGGVRIKQGDESFTVRLVIEPLHQPRELENLLLVSFADEDPPNMARAKPARSAKGAPSADPPPEDCETTNTYESIIHHLEEDLSITRDELQSTIEELESSNEEFKAANEEVTSINEELQSSNEELETSKEELQSLNEELQTVNSQLEQKVLELETTNNDLSNLLASSDVGTIFLDRKFCLRRFTPAVRPLLRVIPSDIGRPIRDFARNFTDDELLTDSERVLQTLIPIEKEIQDVEGRWYIRRILPYRTDDDRIEGVVINFTDITRKKEDEQALRDAAAQLEQRVHQRTSDLESANVSLLRGEQRFRTLLESAPDAMLVVEHGGEIAQVNHRAEQLFGYTRDELLGRPFETLIPQSPSGENERQRADFFSAPQTESAALGARLVGLRKDKSEFPIDIQFSPLDVNDRQFSIAAIRDMTQREHASEALSRLAAIMEGASAAIVVTSLDGAIQHWNEGAAHLFGYAAAEAVGYSVSMLASANDALSFPRLVERLRAGQRFEEYHTMTHKDGALLDVAATASLIDDASGQVTGVCIVARDFGERKRLEQLIAELTDQERQRLGRELHDSVSQQISGISMLLATLKAQMGETAQDPILERLENTIDETKRQLRALTKGVFPVDVDARGLRIALEELAQQVTSTTGVACRFECTDEVPLDDNFVATQLYLIAREAAFNAAKHSGGAMITIRLEDHEGGIQVSVRDNGKGLPELVERSDGMGLRIMRHRCGLLNGSLHFDAIAEGGTCVRCHVKRRNPT